MCSNALSGSHGFVDDLANTFACKTEFIPNFLKGLSFGAHLDNGSIPGFAIICNALPHCADLGDKLLEFFIHATHSTETLTNSQVRKANNILDKVDAIPYYSPIG